MRPNALAAPLLLTLGCAPAPQPVTVAAPSDAGRVEQLQARVAALEEQNAVLQAQVVGLQEDNAALQGKTEALEAKRTRRRHRPNPDVRHYVPIAPDDPRRGPEDAEITIIGWGDFQCPFTRRAQPTISALQRKYKGRIRYVWKDNPLAFHEQARSAALAAHAAGRQGKFWEMFDLLFEHQKELGDASYLKWARQLGLDVKRFKRDLRDPKLAAAIEIDQKQAAEIEARGTPSFLINGWPITGAQPEAAFWKVIDPELERVAERLRKGRPKNGIYEAMVGAGRE